MWLDNGLFSGLFEYCFLPAPPTIHDDFYKSYKHVVCSGLTAEVVDALQRGPAPVLQGVRRIQKQGSNELLVVDIELQAESETTRRYILYQPSSGRFSLCYLPGKRIIAAGSTCQDADIIRECWPQEYFLRTHAATFFRALSPTKPVSDWDIEKLTMYVLCDEKQLRCQLVATDTPAVCWFDLPRRHPKLDTQEVRQKIAEAVVLSIAWTYVSKTEKLDDGMFLDDAELLRISEPHVRGIDRYMNFSSDTGIVPRGKSVTLAPPTAGN